MSSTSDLSQEDYLKVRDYVAKQIDLPQADARASAENLMKWGFIDVGETFTAIRERRMVINFPA